MKPNRCCDFTPFFPNFLVGAGLLQNKKLYLSMAKERFHPLGLLPPLAVEGGAGMDSRLDMDAHRVCDFFEKESGRCLNWSLRPAECAGFYCEEGLKKLSFFDGDGGMSEWLGRSARLFEGEFAVAQRALHHMGFSWRRISAWVEEWNLWVEEKRPMENRWRTSLEERFEFYGEIWRWLKDSGGPGDLVFDHLEEMD